MAERPDMDRDDTDRDDDVRRLLSSLRSPGPMPPELVQRITASLAEEQSRREHESRGATVHSLAETRTRRSLPARLPGIAIAASIVVLAGAAVMGLLGNQGLLGGGSDASTGEEMMTATQMSGRDGAAADTDSDDSATLLDAPADDSAGDSGEAATKEMEGTLAAGPAFVGTGALVTSVTLRDHVVELRSRAPLPVDEEAQEALGASAVASPTAAADCLADLLPESAAEIEPRVDVVDAVRFGGMLRALIIVTDEPAGRAGPATAYLVPLDCRPGTATLQHEPVRVD